MTLPSNIQPFFGVGTTRSMPSGQVVQAICFGGEIADGFERRTAPDLQTWLQSDALPGVSYQQLLACVAERKAENEVQDEAIFARQQEIYEEEMVVYDGRLKSYAVEKQQYNQDKAVYDNLSRREKRRAEEPVEPEVPQAPSAPRKPQMPVKLSDISSLFTASGEARQALVALSLLKDKGLVEYHSSTVLWDGMGGIEPGPVDAMRLTEAGKTALGVE